MKWFKIACATVGIIGCAALAHGQWTDPVLLPAPINVNPPGDYYYATISADGMVLCVTIDTDSIHGGFGDDDVWISQRLSDSTWSGPVNAGPSVNNNQRNLSPSITGDRQRLYYVCWTGTTYRIFVSYRTGPNWNDWSVGQALPAPIHRGNEFTAQIGYDDSTLIFTSTYRPDTVLIFGDNVMYTSRLRPDTSWSEPQLLAPHLNYMNGSFHPCLTDSGRTLVYGQYWNPHWDVWYAFRNDTGFGPGIRCDSTINTPYWDSSPSCLVDGSLLYFDSRRPLDTSHVDGAAHLYVARRVPSSSTPVHPIRSKHTSMQIIPSYGSLDTQFMIIMPDFLKGQPVRVVNLLGEIVETLVPPDPWDNVLEWRGASHVSRFLASGPYFFVATQNQQTAVGRVLIIR